MLLMMNLKKQAGTYLDTLIFANELTGTLRKQKQHSSRTQIHSI